MVALRTMAIGDVRS
jgi:hypothetical protein